MNLEFEKYIFVYLAISNPTIKKISTDNDVPLPWPNNDPINIVKKIMEDDRILKFIPIINPIIKKVRINNVLPKPIPKYDPT